MRAARVTRYGPPADVTVEELPDLRPRAGQVVVSVHAAAVNFPDVLLAANKYQISQPLPYTPGSEFAGVVLAVGDGVTEPSVGTAVMGVTPTGAMAEQVVVDPQSLRPLPEGLDFVKAAAFQVAASTAYHALVTIGAAAADDWVVVLGAAGGVGLAAVDIGARLGMRVIAVTSSADRAQLCLDRGARAAVDVSTEDVKQRVRELTGSGADVVLDPVGGPGAEQSLRAMRWGGRFVTVGFAHGEIPRIPLNLVLLKGVVVRGLEIRTLEEHLPGSTAAGDEALAALVADGLRPHVSRVHPLNDASEALGDVAARRHTGKVVIKIC
jgi:NADPH2:quinone reductase